MYILKVVHNNKITLMETKIINPSQADPTCVNYITATHIVTQ